MNIKLKDGSITQDVRCDRIIRFDERSKKYGIMQTIPREQRKLRSYTWRCNTILDQGNEGSCVGHGIGHELISRPSEVPNITHKYAKEVIYWRAQRRDPWEGGAYPGANPFYEGTDVLSGVKVAQELGWFDSYYWAFGLEQLIYGVGHRGPAVLGTYWYQGMNNTDRDGFVHVTGDTIGGHCYEINKVDVKLETLGGVNSWGLPWGVNGTFTISFEDMDKLLRNQGEAVFFQKRHKKPHIQTI